VDVVFLPIEQPKARGKSGTEEDTRVKSIQVLSVDGPDGAHAPLFGMCAVSERPAGAGPVKNSGE